MLWERWQMGLLVIHWRMLVECQGDEKSGMVRCVVGILMVGGCVVAV